MNTIKHCILFLVLVLMVSQCQGFLKKEIMYDFVEASPSHPLIFSYPMIPPARGDMQIEIFITGDFGYFFDPTEHHGVNQHKQSGLSRDRSMSITISPPSGRDIFLGTFFNSNQIDNEPKYTLFPQTFYYFDDNNMMQSVPNIGDVGYYNVQNHLVFQIPHDKIHSITAEGSFQIIFTFSKEVNPFFEPYPSFNPFGLNELQMTVVYP